MDFMENMDTWKRNIYDWWYQREVRTDVNL